MNLKTIYICISLLLCNTLFSQNPTFPRRVNVLELDTNNYPELFLYNAIKSTQIDTGISYYNKYIQTQNDTAQYILFALLHSANKLIHIQKYESSKIKIERCLKIAQKYKAEYYIYQSYLLFAQIEHLKSNQDASIEWHDKAIKSTSDEYLINFAKLSLSHLYFSLRKKESIKMGMVLNNEIYAYYLKYDKKIRPNLACEMLIVKSLNDTIGKSLEYIKEASFLVKDIPFSSLKMKVNKEFARVLLKNQNEKEALILYNKLISTYEKNRDYQEANLIYLSLSQYFNSKNQFKKSQYYIDKINKRKYPFNLKQTVYLLSIENYAGLKDFEKAYDLNEELMVINDSIQKRNEELKYTEWAIKYKTEKKEHENDLLKKENKIKKIELEQNKIYFLILLTCILITLGFVILFYKLFSWKKKSEKRLEISNKTILEQNDKLYLANKTKSTFFTLIAHDLINPYNVIMGYSDLLKNNFTHFSEEKVQEFIEKIHTSVYSNYGFVKNLLMWAKANQSQISTELAPIKSTDLLSETILPLNLLIDKKSISFDNNLQYKSPIITDKQILKTVLFNITTNAIKFTPMGGKIVISDYYKDGYYFISVKDNGVGMSNKHIDELFDLTKTHSTKGTQNETGGGLGLLLCHELIQLIKGELIISSEIGTEVKIKIKDEQKTNNSLYH